MVDIYKRIKIDVKTPKNKADKSIKSLKRSILMFKKDDIVEQEKVAHNRFYWIVDTFSEKEYKEIIKKCAKAEYKIQKFYTLLIKGINMVNKTCSRFKIMSKAAYAIAKKRLLNFLKGKGVPKDSDNYKKISEMPPEEMKEFLSPEGVEDVQNLIDNDIIEVTNVEPKQNY